MKLRFISHADSVRSALRAGKASVLASGGGVLLERARARCPVDTGELRASGHCISNDREARVAFSAPHAVYAHERPGSKFLESAANDGSVRSEILQAMQGLF